MLEANAQKAARERLTLIRIFEELQGLGFDGSYAAVRRYALRWGEEHSSSTAAAYIPLSFAPGEAYQFDWSHEIVVLNGATTTVKVAHVRLCHSRMMFVRAYPRETQEMVFDAHDRAFAFFRGACQRGIYDNMKTAVETVFVGKDRQYNRRFLQMCSHYLVEPVACTPASGWEKGQVENQVGLVRERFFTPRLRFKSYDDLNAWLIDKCLCLGEGASPTPSRANARSGRSSKTSGRSWSSIAVASTASTARRRRCRRLCLVRFDNNHYSVNASAVGRPVEFQAYADRVVIRQDGRVVAEHPRKFRARRNGLRSLALRAGAGAQARRAAQRRAVQGLGAAGFARQDPPQALRLRRRRPADGQDPRRRADRRAAGGRGRLRQALAEGVHSADVILNILARRREPPAAGADRTRRRRWRCASRRSPTAPATTASGAPDSWNGPKCST